MAGRLTRQEARAELRKVFEASLDQYIPADESQPVKDGLFYEWEDQADAFDRQVTGKLVEVLAGLSGQARPTQPGACPHCQSAHTRWLDAAAQQERQSKHGAVVLPRQRAQCRSCGRSFSPAGGRLGSGLPGGPDAAGGRAGGAGSGREIL